MINLNLSTNAMMFLLLLLSFSSHNNTFENNTLLFFRKGKKNNALSIAAALHNPNSGILSRHESPSLVRSSDSVLLPFSSTQNSAFDTSWEFTHGLEGWAQATKSEMNAEVFHMGGEMKIHVLGSLDGDDDDDDDEKSHRANARTEERDATAHIDSPLMKILIVERQTLAFRYRFNGRSKFAKIRLRGSQEPLEIDHGLVDWGRDFEEEEHGFLNLYFPVQNDGLWHIGYAEIDRDKVLNVTVDKLNGTITQLRFWPGVSLVDEKNSVQISKAPLQGSSFHIDWVRITRAPIINRVTGCSGEKYFWTKEQGKEHPEYNIKSYVTTINDMLHHYRTEWIRRETNHPYSLTYNCRWEGFERITIEGHNFGFGGVNGSGAPAHVFIDGEPCTYVEHDLFKPQEKMTCLTPKFQDHYKNDIQAYQTSIVEVHNGKLTGLSDMSLSLQYAVPPPKPINLSLSNFASRSIDISWKPGGSVWDQMTCTGFNIKWKEYNDGTSSWSHTYTTGNITTTTIRGLQPNTTYVFGIAALNEDQSQEWNNLDLYGRRLILDDGLEGPTETIVAHTLLYDVAFSRFDANSTQNHGPEIHESSIGPTGREDGEGHYGLVLTGHANIQNCNSTSFCCDTFDESTGTCGDRSFVCMGTMIQRENDHGGQLPGFGKIVERFNTSLSTRFRNLFHFPCGPALRLTASQSRQVGAAWYPRQMEVGEGFEANFTFRISNPSFRCNNMHKIYTHCRSRGGDGLAFVIQGEGLDALGGNGKGMGYGGINNSLAVEFDTYYNFEVNDPYENHVSIQTRGWRNPNNEDHVYSLGHSNDVPDLTDGIMNIRIKYEPFFDLSYLDKRSFVTFPHMAHFFQNDNYHSGGLGDWGNEGLGLLHIYCQNMNDPILTVPLHLSKTLKLNRGRAWVGFTASTGDETYQVHDVLDFTFSSLRYDESSTK